jgi:hypothetical protein
MKEEPEEELKEELQEEEGHSAPTWHAAHAWLNVNRSGDSNEMHMHDARRWSAVYFVAGLTGGTAPAAVGAYTYCAYTYCASTYCGLLTVALTGGTDPATTAGAGSGSGNGPAADVAAADVAAVDVTAADVAAVDVTAADVAAADVGGYLLFRAGGVQGSTHSFLAVPPEPGTMWLFPGGLPHCVMPFVDSGEGHAGGPGGHHPGDMPGDRISVAINFEDAAPPG